MREAVTIAASEARWLFAKMLWLGPGALRDLEDSGTQMNAESEDFCHILVTDLV